MRKKLTINLFNSDSEVVLASFLKWGKDCLKYLNGMFSFAIWAAKTTIYRPQNGY